MRKQINPEQIERANEAAMEELSKLINQYFGVNTVPQVYRLN